MDTMTGKIYSPEEVEKLKQNISDGDNQRIVNDLVPMDIPPTPDQLDRRPPVVRVYEWCPCGSGKKFKKCCKKRGDSRLSY